MRLMDQVWIFIHGEMGERTFQFSSGCPYNNCPPPWYIGDPNYIFAVPWLFWNPFQYIRLDHIEPAEKMHLGGEDPEPFGCVFLSAVLGPVSRFKPYLKIYWNLKHCPFVYSENTKKIWQEFWDIHRGVTIGWAGVLLHILGFYKNRVLCWAKD